GAPAQGQPGMAAEAVRAAQPGAVTAAGPSSTPASDRAAAEPGKTAKASESTKPRPETKLFPGSVATLEKPDGILLRATEQKPDWERVVDETPLKPGDRIVSLAPFRTAIDMEKLRIQLISDSGETELRLLPHAPDAPPAFELVQGQIVVRRPEAGKFRIVFGKQAVDVDATSDAVFGMERVNRNAYGQATIQDQWLGILCQKGDVTLKAAGDPQTLKSMNVALISANGKVQAGQGDAMPPWLSQPDPSPSELQLREEFMKLFHPGRPLLTEIVGALDDERPEVKQLAVEALGAMGDLSYLMPTLSRPNDPVARRATIAAIHKYMMRGPEASAKVRDELIQLLGDELGEVTHHMLIGYTPEEFARPDLAVLLVGLLSPDHQEDGIVGVRELALVTLRQMTGRDDLGYNPDKPAGKGFDAWNDLLRRNELRPPAPRPNGKARTKPGR
ncbi:MAG: HEAT repeat domain-containing protein, partial [Isosphaeraceae bacterium]